jgi:hypothetical protein
MRRVISTLAIIGFFTSLIVHLSTFLGINPARFGPGVWVLHVGMFAVLVPMIFDQGRMEKKTFQREIFSALPGWARHLISVFFVYAIINLALFVFLSGRGVPSERDGKYALHSHGSVIRELSEEEYDRHKAYELRAFSGHWMVFYLIPALYFSYRKDKTDVSGPR